MALNAALSTPHTIGGVIGLSGHVFPQMLELVQTDNQGTFDEKKKNLRIFTYHGKDDNLIPESKAAKSYELLKAAGFEKLSYYGEDDLEHSVSQAEIRAI